MGTRMFKMTVSKKDTPELRHTTKTCVFLTVYGGGPYKLAAHFEGDVKRAEEVQKMFFDAFPDIDNYLTKLGQFAKTNYYSRTFPPFNRIRWYEKPKPASNRSELAKAISSIERAGKNHPIQGTCADIVKYATLKVHQYIKENNLEAMIVNQVHDEIVIEFNTKIVDGEKLDQAISEIMLKAAKVSIKTIPMETEGTISKHWEK